MDKPPFDTVRASFFLIAGILVFQCVAVMIALVWCIYHFDPVKMPDFQCDKTNKFSDLLTAALAAALAFAGGFSRSK